MRMPRTKKHADVLAVPVKALMMSRVEWSMQFFMVQMLALLTLRLELTLDYGRSREISR